MYVKVAAILNMQIAYTENYIFFVSKLAKVKENAHSALFKNFFFKIYPK